MPKDSWFSNQIDHFTTNGKDWKYQQRYLISDATVEGQDAPIIFYCGNEGGVEDFWTNSGFLTG